MVDAGDAGDVTTGRASHRRDAACRARAALVPLVAAFVGIATAARAEPFVYVDRRGIAHTLVVPSPGDAAPAATEPADVAPETASDAGFPYAALVLRAARASSLSPALIRAVMEVESSAHPRAVSPAGARGLMQLMPETARELGVADPFDPEENVPAGARRLRALLDALHESLPLALAAYNAGLAAVQRAHGVPPLAETRRYVERVLARVRALEGAPIDEASAGNPRHLPRASAPPEPRPATRTEAPAAPGG